MMKKYTYEDLCNAPVGTKILFENGDVLVEVDKTDRSCYIWQSLDDSRSDKDLKNLKDNFGSFGKIIKIEEPQYTTVYEAKTEILDEKEREYLSNVIEPFKNRDIRIIKFTTPYDTEYISIGINDEHYIDFPYFEEGTMYKGLEPNRHYSLKELGLN